MDNDIVRMPVHAFKECDDWTALEVLPDAHRA
jgi:hypothetical protein